MRTFKKLQAHIDAALADPTGPLTGEPGTAPAPLPRRVKGATLTPEHDDDLTASEAIAEVQIPHPGEIDMGPLVRSSSQAGLATLMTTPSLVVIDAQEALNEAAFAWVDADPDHDPLGSTTADLIAAIVRFRAVTR